VPLCTLLQQQLHEAALEAAQTSLQGTGSSSGGSGREGSSGGACCTPVLTFCGDFQFGFEMVRM
jgi:hypothetical protein